MVQGLILPPQRPQTLSILHGRLVLRMLHRHPHGPDTSIAGLVQQQPELIVAVPDVISLIDRLPEPGANRETPSHEPTVGRRGIDVFQGSGAHTIGGRVWTGRSYILRGTLEGFS